MHVLAGAKPNDLSRTTQAAAGLLASLPGVEWKFDDDKAAALAAAIATAGSRRMIMYMYAQRKGAACCNQGIHTCTMHAGVAGTNLLNKQTSALMQSKDTQTIMSVAETCKRDSTPSPGMHHVTN